MIELPCSLTPGRFDSKFGDLYDGPQPTSITLLRIIYGGPRVWSQVYEARVDSWDRPVADSQPSERFILKLYVASELSNLENADADDFDHLGANPQEAQRAMTQQETLAYSKLIGCPVTPRWYGTYQFTLPSGESTVGILLEYLDGKSMDEGYALKTLPFAERMVTAAEALDQIHSRGVWQGDIREPNIIVLTSPQERFPIRFIDFGSRVVDGYSCSTEEYLKHSVDSDTTDLMWLLVRHFGLTYGSSRPLLRAIPREGAIIKFLQA